LIVGLIAASKNLATFEFNTASVVAVRAHEGKHVIPATSKMNPGGETRAANPFVEIKLQVTPGWK
jgi:hypothetical protein